MIELERVKRTHPIVLECMAKHYSQPKGFVGRNICYLICYGSGIYGAIVGGSATKNLGYIRDMAFPFDLNNIVNNIFFHVERPYPVRNFVVSIIQQWRNQILKDWQNAYGDKVLGFETLVEPPRTGEAYLRDNWMPAGRTIGYTCKRTGGEGTDSWSGKRVWNTTDLRPKLIFIRQPWWP